MNTRQSMKIIDISKEYATVNLVLISIIFVILAMPYTLILSEYYEYYAFPSYIPKCFVLSNTGKPCPTCGLTRSVVLLYKGQFYKSVVQYSYGYLFVLLLGAQLFLRVIPLFSRRVWIPYMDITQMILCGILWLFIIN